MVGRKQGSKYAKIRAVGERGKEAAKGRKPKKKAPKPTYAGTRG